MPKVFSTRLVPTLKCTNSIFMFSKRCSITFFGLGLLALLAACGSSKNSSMNDLVARMEVKSPIEGVCDNTNVIAVLPFPGNAQVEAKPAKSEEEIAKELNEKVVFLKDKPDYEDKGMVRLIVNCKGEMVQCAIDNKTQSPELDAQIVAVFASLTGWKAGSVRQKPVDTVVLYSFTIKDGKIILK